MAAPRVPSVVPGKYVHRSDIIAGLYEYRAQDESASAAASAISVKSKSLSKSELQAHYGSSAEVVFSINELLERIILHLDPLSIVRAQRVNSSWHNVIERKSDALLREMYLLPAGPARGAYRCSHLWSPPLSKTYSTMKSMMDVVSFKQGRMMYFDDCRPNEAFTFDAKPCLGVPPPLDYGRVMTGITERLFKAKSGTLLAKMFITQPPVTRAMFVWQMHCVGKGYGHPKARSPFATNSIYQEEGITVGDVYKAFAEARRATFHDNQVGELSCLKLVFLAYAPKRDAVPAPTEVS